MLIASMQLSVTQMNCLLTGKTIYSLEKMDCGPSDSSGNCEVEKKCCDIHTVSFDFVFGVNLNQVAFEFIPFTADFVQLITLKHGFSGVIDLSFQQLSNPPPNSLFGIDLLKSIQVFRL